MNTRLIHGSMLTAVLAVGGIAGSALAFDHADGSAPSRKTGEVRVETLAVTDLSDDRKLVGLAHDVFVGTVVRERGRTISEPVPEIQFDVRVRRAIKGALTGVVVVSQQGGVNETGDTVVVDGDLPLQSGRTYLFATRTNETTGWHTVIPRHGDLPVDNAQNETRVLQRFGAARAAEVPFTPGG